MAASLSFYTQFKEKMADGGHDLDADTFKLMLVTSTYTFSAAHTVKTDITNELSTANGYTAGGATLGSVTWDLSGSNARFDAADVVWTASGGSIVARRAILYNDTSASKLLVCSILLDTTPADVTATAGNTLTVQWNASGIFEIQ